jgi:hypothetical protein
MVEEAARKAGLTLFKYDLDLMMLAYGYWKGNVSRGELEKAVVDGRMNDCELRAIIHGGNPFTWDCLKCREYGEEVCDIECSVACEDCVHLRLCVAEGRKGLMKYLEQRMVDDGE